MHLVYWQFWTIVTPLSVALGCITGAIVYRLTRPPTPPRQGCDDCGTALQPTDGPCCPHCVALRRSVLKAQGDRENGLTTHNH